MKLSCRQINRVAGDGVGALEVPAEADGNDRGISQSAAALLDDRALQVIFDGDREQHLKAVEPAEDLLRRDDAESASGSERRDAQVRGKLVAVAIPHGVGLVEIEQGCDDV